MNYKLWKDCHIQLYRYEECCVCNNERKIDGEWCENCDGEGTIRIKDTDISIKDLFNMFKEEMNKGNIMFVK